MSSKLVHSQPVRESAERRVEVLEPPAIRVGIWRGSPGCVDPADFVMTSGFTLSIDDARELRAAIGLAISTLEAEA